jgi:voltage-gated potassium channel
VRHVRSAIRYYFLERRHTVLLAVIVAAFLTRPVLGDNAASHFTFSAGLLALLLLALYTIQIDELVGERGTLLAERKRRAAIGWLLFVFAIIERMATLIIASPRVYLIGSATWLAFLSFITWHELRAVLRQKTVTGETISMSISVYLLIGMTFGLVYALIDQLQAHAFSFPILPASRTTFSPESQDSLLATLVYYSFTTLTTIGYGDITPLSLQARYVAVIEGITGQFYIAVLVARLVSLQMMGTTPTVEEKSGRKDL